jgi:hypothetical protein
MPRRRSIPGPADAFVRGNDDDEDGEPTTTTTATVEKMREMKKNVLNRQRQLEEELDADLFASAPWKRALEALDVEIYNPNSLECRNNVGWVRRGGWRCGRVPRMICAFREYGTSSNGDGAATVCDPTGEMRAVIHRDLVTSEPDLGAGCVCVLKDAPVLSVNSMAHALVVSNESLVAVFKAEVDLDALATAKRSMIEERQQLRERLRENAVRDALDVDWDDGAMDADANEAHENREDPQFEDSKTDEKENMEIARDEPAGAGDCDAAVGRDEDEGTGEDAFAKELAALYGL